MKELSDIKDAAQGIKIISEISDVETNFAPVVIPLQEAERIIFLGFGYNRVNLDRLFFNYDPRRGDLSFYGTCVGLTGLEQEKVNLYFLNKVRSQITLQGDILTLLRGFISLSE